MVMSRIGAAARRLVMLDTLWGEPFGSSRIVEEVSMSWHCICQWHTYALHQMHGVSYFVPFPTALCPYFLQCTVQSTPFPDREPA